ncbi:MAG: hypothetical protein ABI596_00135 [Pyrinomonadaceae bacterium]
MGIEGGGSLVIDSRHKFHESGSGSGPYTYTEEGVDDEDRYGDIDIVTVITEIESKPFVSVLGYTALLPGTELWLWYQDISASPVGEDDATFPPVTFPDNDPQIRIVGGSGANLFKLMVKRKKFSHDKSHKKNRPHRYKQGGGSGLARHFRIGQWRLVRAGTTLVGDKGAENYNFFVRFGHYQEP